MRIDHPKIRLILSSFSDEEAARVVVRQLLEERLIACGTLVPGARSLYWWQGKIEESGEVLTLLKTEAETTARCMDPTKSRKSSSSIPWMSQHRIQLG